MSIIFELGLLLLRQNYTSRCFAFSMASGQIDGVAAFSMTTHAQNLASSGIYQQMRNLFLLVLMALAVVSCKKDTVSYEEQLKIDSDKIEAYLAEKNLTAEKTASGLYYIITLEGTGAKPVATSTVTVGYKGYFLDGAIFDQTYGSAWAQFNVSGVVPGFREALQLLKNKGKGTFFMPSGLAYGASGAGSIPANTPLIFEIDLVDFF